MDASTKRRFTMFGAGLAIGTPLAILLFQYAMQVQETNPRETRNVEVVLTTCALKPGDVFAEDCVEKRVVAEQFVPPNAIAGDNVASYIDKPIWVALEPGSAVRTVDFDKKE